MLGSTVGMSRNVSNPRPTAPTGREREETIRRVLAGKDYRSAAHELVRLYADEIYRFCVHAIGNRQDGEDLAQEVLGDACRSLTRFKGRSTVRTWLYKVAWHKVYDQRKRLARQPHLVPIDGLVTSELLRLGTGHGADDALAATQRHKQISRALRQLSSYDRTLLFMRVAQEMPFQDIAGVLGIRVGAAKMRMNRAVQRLRDEVQR